MKKKASKPSKCGCSFCEEELKDGCMEPEFCTPCAVVFIKCKKCGAKVSDKIKVCAQCGRKI